MKSFLHTIRTHPVIFLYIVVLLQLAYFMYVSSRPYRVVPPGKTYTIIGKNFYYPSMIRQAEEGAWGIKDTHTTRNSPVVYAQLFFVIMGKLAALGSIEPVQMFQITRITGAIFSALGVWWFCRQYFSKTYAVIAALLATALETAPSLASLASFNLSKIIPAWDVHTILERRFSLPHHTYGEAIGIVFFGLLFNYILHPPQTIRKQVIGYIIIFVIGFIATTVLPPYIVIFTGASMPVLLFISYKRNHIREYIQFLAPALLGIGIAAIFIKLEFSKGSPWDNWTAAEKSWMTNQLVITEYIQSLWLYYPLALIGVVLTFLRKQSRSQLLFPLLLSLSWLIIPAVFIPFSGYSFFPFANFRLVDLYGYVPASMLATIGLYQISQCISSLKIRRLIIGGIVGMFVLISAGLSYAYTLPVFAAQDNQWSQMYVTNDGWEGIQYMAKLPKGSGVMVREMYGEMLPAFGSVTSFIGGAHGFPDWGQRQWITGYFYSGTLSSEEARTILHDNNIQYVFWGTDEKNFTRTTTLYPDILQPVFTNKEVTIFKVLP